MKDDENFMARQRAMNPGRVARAEAADAEVAADRAERIAQLPGVRERVEAELTRVNHRSTQEKVDSIMAVVSEEAEAEKLGAEVAAQMVEHDLLIAAGFDRDDDGYRRGDVFLFRSQGDCWGLEHGGVLIDSDIPSVGLALGMAIRFIELTKDLVIRDLTARVTSDEKALRLIQAQAQTDPAGSVYAPWLLHTTNLVLEDR